MAARDSSGQFIKGAAPAAPAKRRSAGSAALAKAKQTALRARHSRSLERKTAAQEAAVLAGGVTLGLVERLDWDIPSIPGVPDPITYGVISYVLGDRMVGGKAGDALRGAGVGMLACGLRDLVAGRARLGEAIEADAYDDLDLDDLVDDDMAA